MLPLWEWRNSCRAHVHRTYVRVRTRNRKTQFSRNKAVSASRRSCVFLFLLLFTVKVLRLVRSSIMKQMLVVEVVCVHLISCRFVLQDRKMLLSFYVHTLAFTLLIILAIIIAHLTTHINTASKFVAYLLYTGTLTFPATFPHLLSAFPLSGAVGCPRASGSAPPRTSETG